MESPGNNPELTESDLKKIRALLPILQRWRDDYIDDLPAERIKHDDPNYYRYKCRMNVYGNFVNIVELFLPYFDDELSSEARAFIHFVREEMDWQAMRTREDIDRANDLNKKVTAFIEKEMQLNAA